MDPKFLQLLGDAKIWHRNWASYLDVICETIFRVGIFCNLENKTQVTEASPTRPCCTLPP